MWRLKVIVEDDGTGMPPQARFGLGLIGLQERVQALGGEFALHRVEPWPQGRSDSLRRLSQRSQRASWARPCSV